MSRALELIDQVAQEPTLDVALDRDPSTVTEQELRERIQVLRMQRPHFTLKGRRHKAEETET